MWSKHFGLSAGFFDDDAKRPDFYYKAWPLIGPMADVEANSTSVGHIQTLIKGIVLSPTVAGVSNKSKSQAWQRTTPIAVSVFTPKTVSVMLYSRID